MPQYEAIEIHATDSGFEVLEFASGEDGAWEMYEGNMDAMQFIDSYLEDGWWIISLDFKNGQFYMQREKPTS